jgi:hypothetical protein
MDEALALMLLPAALEGAEHEVQARELLSIPRVIALEPARVRTPRFLREGTVARQAARIRLSGELRVVILYHPAQYPLARALCGRHERAELWYIAPEPATIGDEELRSFDELARERASGVIENSGTAGDEPLRARLRELEVINPHAYMPSARFARSRPGKGSGGRG